MKRKIGNQKEQDIQRAVKDYLKYIGAVVMKFPSVGIRKPDGSYIPLPKDEVGVSDLIGCLPGGRFFSCEIKRPGKKPTAHQLAFLEKVNAKGGLGIVAYDLEDVRDALQKEAERNLRAEQGKVAVC